MTAGFNPSGQTEPLNVSFNLSLSDIPESLKAQAIVKAKEAYVTILLAAGEISSGKAASLQNRSLSFRTMTNNRG